MTKKGKIGKLQKYEPSIELKKALAKAEVDTVEEKGEVQVEFDEGVLIRI